jgi:hypothetical protein
MYQNGQHGLITSLDLDGGGGVGWGLSGTDVSNSESSWDGVINTQSIISAGGSATGTFFEEKT